MMKRKQAKWKNEKAITLIALVITMVVLLILAGITINMLFSNGGIFKTAQDAVNAWNEATVNEQESLNSLAEQIQNLVNGQVGGETGGEEPWIPPTTIEEAITQDKIFEETKQIKDDYDNIVTVPKGFKVTDEATTVPEGIVIEDANGNQFVWIPIGIVYKNVEKTESSTIKLGRYTFDRANGTPTMVQAALDGDNLSNLTQTYEDETEIEVTSSIVVGITTTTYYKELITYREGMASSGTDGLNATAKNLKRFVESVKNNGGYYLARYEASYGSGYNNEGSTDAEKYAKAKPLSKISTTKTNASNMQLTPGILWNNILQSNASIVSQNMYANDTTVGVESDLTNSYAWDTAIVFIQSMKAENSNYANENYSATSIANTGETIDKVCNIFDISSNISEWTTEYSTKTEGSENPCTYRGGSYRMANDKAGSRKSYKASMNSSLIGFRVLLYVK